MTVLGVSVSVSGVSLPVEEPELGSEVSGALEVLGDTDSEGLDDDEVPLHPDNTRISPAEITSALLRRFTTPPTNEMRTGRV